MFTEMSRRIFLAIFCTVCGLHVAFIIDIIKVNNLGILRALLFRILGDRFSHNVKTAVLGTNIC